MFGGIKESSEQPNQFIKLGHHSIANRSKYDGESNFVYGGPNQGRRDQEFLKQQSSFNFTWRLINQNGIEQMREF
jgi:hypothetical protein